MPTIFHNLLTWLYPSLGDRWWKFLSKDDWFIAVVGKIKRAQGVVMPPPQWMVLNTHQVDTSFEDPTRINEYIQSHTRILLHAYISVNHFNTFNPTVLTVYSCIHVGNLLPFFTTIRVFGIFTKHVMSPVTSINYLLNI